MKEIDKNELYQNLRGFLKSKGVTLEEGIYSKRVEQGCHALAGVINTGQDVVARAKVEVNKGVDYMRQSIHEATAPKPPRPAPAASKPGPAKAAAAPGKKTTAAKAKAPPRKKS